MTKDKTSISLPHGIKDILSAEAELVVSSEKEILSVFSSKGYKRIITPSLEYMDVLERGIDKDFKNQVVKFIEPDSGRLVAIRPDITPQIARMVSTRMKDVPRPLKLCYSENVLRYDDDKRTKIREVIQVGAECITDSPSTEADIEMVEMAIESLKNMGVKDFKIDLGEIGFVRTLFDNIKGTDKEIAAVKNAVGLKDKKALDKALSGLSGVDGSVKEAFLGLTDLYGGVDVLDKADELSGKVNGLKDTLANVKNVVEGLRGKGYADYITVDLGEMRGFDYYTGIIFEGFAAKSGKALLSGGRYDGLIGQYGCACSATGFAFDMTSVASALGGVK